MAGRQNLVSQRESLDVCMCITSAILRVVFTYMFSQHPVSSFPIHDNMQHLRISSHLFTDMFSPVSVSWLVCPQDYTKTTGQISTKLG